jgi:uncharacterized protein (DUF2062 family)
MNKPMLDCAIFCALTYVLIDGYVCWLIRRRDERHRKDQAPRAMMRQEE